MSYNTGHTANVWSLHAGQLVDEAAVSTSYVAVPYRGRLTDAFACIATTQTGSDTVVTVKRKSGTTNSIDLGTITITTAESAAGWVYRIAMTGSASDREFTAGDTLQFVSGGQGSGTVITNFVATFKGM